MTKDTLSLSHLKQHCPGMVDIGHKPVSKRSAEAQAEVLIPSSLGLFLREQQGRLAKGSLFDTAIIAGTMAAKNTALLIPFCHNLPISSIDIHIDLASDACIRISCRAQTCAQSGVEMEALMGASAAALTVYDMCKSHSSALVINAVRLVQKTGGKRDYLWAGVSGRQEREDERSQGSPQP